MSTKRSTGVMEMNVTICVTCQSLRLWVQLSKWRHLEKWRIKFNSMKKEFQRPTQILQAVQCQYSFTVIYIYLFLANVSYQINQKCIDKNVSSLFLTCSWCFVDNINNSNMFIYFFNCNIQHSSFKWFQILNIAKFADWTQNVRLNNSINPLRHWT